MTELRLPTEQGEEVTVSLNSGSEEGCLGWIKSSDNTDISELFAEVVVKNGYNLTCAWLCQVLPGKLICGGCGNWVLNHAMNCKLIKLCLH